MLYYSEIGPSFLGKICGKLWATETSIIIIMLAMSFALRATVKLRDVNERTLMKFQ